MRAKSSKKLNKTSKTKAKLSRDPLNMNFFNNLWVIKTSFRKDVSISPELLSTSLKTKSKTLMKTVLTIWSSPSTVSFEEKQLNLLISSRKSLRFSENWLNSTILAALISYWSR